MLRNELIVSDQITLDEKREWKISYTMSLFFDYTPFVFLIYYFLNFHNLKSFGASRFRFNDTKNTCRYTHSYTDIQEQLNILNDICEYDSLLIQSNIMVTSRT